MRFAYISHVADGLPFWLRTQDEGNEVMVYVPDTPESFVHRDCGKGLVPLASRLEQIVAWGTQQPCVFVFDCSHEGKTAEMLRRRGCLVVGGGEFCDKLEGDRQFGETLAQNLGMLAPPTKQFSTISQAIAFLKGPGAANEWFFKTDANLSCSTTAGGSPERIIPRLETYIKRYKDATPNILQMSIPGVDISTACWWNGRDWVGPFEGTIEKKKLMDGEIGPATGCAMNVVWFYEGIPKIARELHFEAIGEVFRRFNAPPGVYDINAIIAEEAGPWGPARVPYFLEWTPRFGYDAEPTAMRALEGEVGAFFHGLATGKIDRVPFRTDVAQMSLRVTIPPYPLDAIDEFERRRRMQLFTGVRVNGPDPTKPHQLYGMDYPFMAYGLGLNAEKQLIVIDPVGTVGLVCAEGVDLEEMNEEILDYCKDELDAQDKQHRTDGGKALTEHAAKIKKLGYSVDPLEV